MKTFRKYFLVISMILSVDLAQAQTVVDSLLNLLDIEIEQKDIYEREKREKLAGLKKQLSRAKSIGERFEKTAILFGAYKNFSMDTALLYARECRNLATSLGDDEKIWASNLMMAEGYKNIGLYNESLRLLDSLPQEAHERLQVPVLERYVSIYYSIANSLPQEDAMKMYKKLVNCRDTLMHIAPNDIGKAINKIEYLKLKGDYEGALAVYEQLPDSLKNPNSIYNAVFDYVVGEVYIETGNVEKGLEYLLYTALSDIRGCDRKYNSLPYIAEILYNRGDVRRAYNYMICALSDYAASNAQCRLKGVTSVLPIITHAYAAYRRDIRKTQRIILVLICCFVICIIIGSVIIYRKNRQLHRDKTALSEHNANLTDINANLSDMMEKSEALNESLESSARAKEDYIGELFNLCSEYINIMSQEHSSILKTIKKGNLGDVERAVTKLESPERLASFYVKFDQCFLDIFPDFISKFNELLDDDYQIELQQGQLTPELRIFALIRLGITDTNKIGAFLHYSNQTVYNYRFRVRSHAKDKATFFDDVSKL